MQTPLLSVQDLSIAYFHKTVLRNISFSLQEGESLGFLGLNGSGKTSTLKAILGIKKPKTGKINIFGMSPRRKQVLSEVGFAPEEASPPEFLTCGEYLHFVGSFRILDKAQRKRKIQDWLDWAQIHYAEKIQSCSKGMKRKIILIQALLGDPKLVILDEPLNGLDPLFVLEFRKKLEEYLKNQGGSLLYSSHILSEVEKICSHIAILHQGGIILNQSTKDAVTHFGTVEQAFSESIQKSKKREGEKS